ncbi:hypothetical protein B484DRAFT_14082, partial [Ochromonadaceae sp. CCMP2298]
MAEEEERWGVLCCAACITTISSVQRAEGQAMMDAESEAQRAYAKIQALLRMDVDAPMELGSPVHTRSAEQGVAQGFARGFASPPPSSQMQTVQATRAFGALDLQPQPDQDSHDPYNSLEAYETYAEPPPLHLLEVRANAEAFERRLHPNEETFHALLQSCMMEKRPETGVGMGGGV